MHVGVRITVHKMTQKLICFPSFLYACSSPHEIRELWARLRKERPELLSNFEEFLLRVSSYIREVNHEKESMEQALKR